MLPRNMYAEKLARRLTVLKHFPLLYCGIGYELVEQLFSFLSAAFFLFGMLSLLSILVIEVMKSNYALIDIS